MKFGRDALVIVILTLVSVLTWIGIEAYHALTKEEIPRVLKEQILPLNDQLPREVFNELRARGSFSEEELNVQPLSVSVENSETPGSDSPEAAPSEALENGQAGSDNNNPVGQETENEED